MNKCIVSGTGGGIVPCIDEIEVFEPLFLLFIPNPFSYISPAALEESIVQGWETLTGHFLFSIETEQWPTTVYNVGEGK